MTKGEEKRKQKSRVKGGGLQREHHEEIACHNTTFNEDFQKR